MANIILTDKCNRRCVYCFAQTKSKSSPRELSLDNLTAICDFLNRSGKKKINLLGGEPTTHPDFSTYIDYLISRNFKLHIFTNAKISKKNLIPLKNFIAERNLDNRKIKFIVNVNEEKYRKADEIRMQFQTFKALNRFVSLSFNIFEEGAKLDFLIDLIVKYDLIPEIRLGLAAPVPGKGNQFLLTRHFRQAAIKINQFSSLCQRNSIDLVFDCGFPLCMFTDEEIGNLYKNKTQLKFTCHPIPDIDPDLNVLHCFPLAEYYPCKLSDFQNLGEVFTRFNSLTAEENSCFGIYPECRECEYKHREMCSGGCKGHYLGAD